MQSNWSLILNVLLLTGVLVAIIRMLWSRHVKHSDCRIETSSAGPIAGEKNDDVIAVRKVHREVYGIPVSGAYQRVDARPAVGVSEPAEVVEAVEPVSHFSPENLVIFLLAKEHRQFAGYELLQTILASGLRFGEGHLFHRHQFGNGQGPVLCSLATATSTGVFDLQNIGAFSVHGLCLFMETSGSYSIDQERFSIMLETAQQLAEGLDAHLLDDERQPWNTTIEARYLKKIQPECV